MRLRASTLPWLALLALLVAAEGSAQEAQPSALPGVDRSRQWRLERIGESHWKLTGDVEIEREGTLIFADEVEIFTDRDLLTARGNVTLTTENQRISADSLEFNTKTRLGTFHHASGSVLLQQAHEQPAEKSEFGTQEPEVFFYGETLEKLGERKYRITRGGFTTCVQPRPRWQLTSGTIILNIDHYALLVHSMMRVKGVPVLYLPVVYYPINKEDRASGFLLPVYGSSRYKGHTLSNAFFWAIGRSRDATFTHDWFSKTGHGFGAEYRYVRSRSSSGEARVYLLREKPTSYVDSTGSTVGVAGSRSFDARGSLAQDLPWKLRARARVDYFSDIAVQQAYNTNVYDASRRQRSYSGSVSGTWGAYSVTASADRSEFFFNTTDSTVSGSMPRLTVSRGEKPFKGLPVYFGVTGEYASLLRETHHGNTGTDTGLRRLDVSPAVRVPFRKWAFFTVNTSIGWRYPVGGEPGPADGAPGAGGGGPIVRRSADPDRGPRVQPDLEHAGQRLRREVQAYDRAVGERAAGHGLRRVAADRPARLGRPRGGRHDADYLRREQPPVRETEDRARRGEVAGDPERHRQADVLHEGGGLHGGLELLDQLRQRGGPEDVGRLAGRAPLPVRGPERDIPRRVQPLQERVHDPGRVRHLRRRRDDAAVGRLEQAPVHP